MSETDFIAKVKIKVRQGVELSAWSFTSISQVRLRRLRHDNPSRLSIGWGMETRSRSKLRDTTSPPRAATVGGTQPVIDTFVEPPSSAAGHTRDGKISSRSTSLEAGPRRTCLQIPRSESAGGTRGLAQGAACDENREAADSEKVLKPAPDEGATFTCSNY